MAPAARCGTPDGMRAHQVAGEVLCIICEAGATAWREQLAFLTPPPPPAVVVEEWIVVGGVLDDEPPVVQALEGDTLPATAARRRVLAEFGSGDLDRLGNHPDVEAIA